MDLEGHCHRRPGHGWYRAVRDRDRPGCGIDRFDDASRPVGNTKQNLGFAFAYNAVGVPIAAGVLYPVFGLLLSPMIAALAMSLSSVSVVANVLRLAKSTAVPSSPTTSVPRRPLGLAKD